MKTHINPSFYKTLFTTSQEIYTAIQDTPTGDFSTAVDAALASRRPDIGLDSAATATLLQLVRNKADVPLRQKVIMAARHLRQKIFGNEVATMVPIEVSSFCSSACKFCGWRSDNKGIIRLSITESAISKQSQLLAAKGFSHFEIAGGDDLHFLQKNLNSMIRNLKQEVTKINPESRVSLCLVPMHEHHYKILKKDGLDCVLTWQETYQKNTYNKLIPTGPKAWGVDPNLKLQKRNTNSVGWMHRMCSQELAIRAGLQVGIGCMIGLSESTESDILSVVRHGQKLIEHYEDMVKPLIIGMPAWNEITTENNDNKIALDSTCFDIEKNFELIGAIYLLAFPNRRAWVFANGRVHPDIQVNAVLTSSVFTSTLVQIAPGAYLDFGKDIDLGSIFERTRGVKISQLTKEIVLSGEQFKHYLASHETFIDKFVAHGMKIVTDCSLL